MPINHSVKTICLGAALLVLSLQLGCSNSAGPSEEAHQMIPLGGNNQWTYAGHQLDSLGNVVPGILTQETESFSQYYLSYTSWPTYLWDSNTQSWAPLSQETGFVSASTGFAPYGGATGRLVFCPYSDASGSGVLCGEAYLTPGGRYWFKLPDNPVDPISYTARMVLTSGNTFDTAIYRATFDSKQYSVTVPAGTFQCYRLIRHFDEGGGQLATNSNSIISLDSMITVDTLYLAPGKGIIKRVSLETRKSRYVYFHEPDWTTERYPTEEYELSSYNIE